MRVGKGGRQRTSVEPNVGRGFEASRCMKFRSTAGPVFREFDDVGVMDSQWDTFVGMHMFGHDRMVYWKNWASEHNVDELDHV